jgi:choline-sulfatase
VRIGIGLKVTIESRACRPPCVSRRAAFAAVLAAIVMTSCERPREEARPAGVPKRNVILLTLDTTRADHLGLYGHKAASTPTLDRLGREGVVFDTAMTVAPLTLPSHSSIMTGLFPPRHGVRDNGTFYLDDRFTTLAEVLHDAGYRTAAFVAAAVLEKKYGLGQGFEVYDEDFARGTPQREFLFAERPADQVAAAALTWLDATPSPFFAWLHFYDAHADYQPPPPFDERFHDSPYDGEIAFVDRTIATLVDRLAARGLLDDSFLVVVADHGESLGEHGEQTHGVFVYDATVRVPFFVRGPGIAANRRVGAVVRTVDLMPTVLELVGITPPDGIDGRSLVALLSNASGPARVGYAEAELPRYHYGWAPLASVRTGTWKLIDAPRPELYQMTSDPKELINLYDREPAVARELARQLRGVRAQAAADSRRALDAATEEKLRSLGYVADAVPASADGEAGPDPKDMIATHVRIQRGRNLMRQGRLDAAIVELTRIVEENPRSVSTWVDLAQAYLRKPDFDRAKVMLERARALAPESAPIYVQLGMLESRRGRPDAAVALLETALAKDPRSEIALVDLAAVLAGQGELARAREAAERALAIDDRSADAMAALGTIALRGNDEARAVDWFEKALHVDPYHPGALMSMGGVEERRGDLRAALGRYEEAIKSTGSRADLHQAIGSVLAQLGRAPEAEIHLVEALRLDPDMAEAHATLAVVADLEGRPERAIAENREAIRLDPRSHQAHGNLAVIFIKQGDFPAARKELEQAIALDAAYPEGQSNLAVVALAEGDLPAARAAADRALELRPKYPEALTNRGIVAEREGDAEAAAGYHRRALAINPDYVEARTNLASALTRLGRHAEAARELEAVLRERPNLPDAHRDLADLYARHLGDPASASEHYRVYLTLVPAGPERDEAARALAALPAPPAARP